MTLTALVARVPGKAAGWFTLAGGNACKSHSGKENMAEGFIKGLNTAKGFTFIALLNGPDVFCHKSALSPELEWDDQLNNRRVVCDLEPSDRGQRAVNVRAAD